MLAGLRDNCIGLFPCEMSSLEDQRPVIVKSTLRISSCVHEEEPRSAIEAGIGLRMIAAIGHVGVLGGALRAHLESAHGGHGAVVGEVLDDGEARSAVRAVDEGVVVTSVLRVEELAYTGVAGGEIGTDERARMLVTC